MVMRRRKHIENTPIDDEAELEIKMLVADVDAGGICPYKFRRFMHFGADIKLECPHRPALKKEWEKEEAKRANRKYHREYPDD